jgi:hypothetical protein
MITINSMQFVDGWWHVHCSISLSDGTRTGLHSVELPETATQAEVEAAVLALYN